MRALSFVVCLAALAPSVAAAQGEPEALRRASQHSARGEHAEAVAVLRAARAATPSPRVDLNLALALAARGQLLRARDLLNGVLASDANPLVIEEARAHLRRIDGRVGRLRLRMNPMVAGAQYYVDARRVARARAEPVEVTLAPGAHRVTVRGASGEILARATIETSAGEVDELALHPVAREAAPPRITVAAPSAPTVTREAPPASAEAAPRVTRSVPTPEVTAALASEPREEMDWLPWAIGGAAAGVVLLTTLTIVLVVVAAPGPTTGDADPIVIGAN